MRRDYFLVMGVAAALFLTACDATPVPIVDASPSAAVLPRAEGKTL